MPQTCGCCPEVRIPPRNEPSLTPAVAIIQLNMRNTDDSLRTFDAVLAKHPTNLVSLLGKVRLPVYLSSMMLTSRQARILFTRKQYAQSLRLFQDVLRYSPSCIPDPRIGIGLCLWHLDQKERAKMAWQRSMEVVSLLRPP